MRRPVERRKRLAPGHPDERAAQIIGPAVITAGEGALPAGEPLVRHEPRAAVAADIEEDTDLAVLRPSHQERHAGDFTRQHAARLAQLILMAEAERIAAEDPRLLGLVSRPVVID